MRTTCTRRTSKVEKRAARKTQKGAYETAGSDAVGAIVRENRREARKLTKEDKGENQSRERAERAKKIEETRSRKRACVLRREVEAEKTAADVESLCNCGLDIFFKVKHFMVGFR